MPLPGNMYCTYLRRICMLQLAWPLFSLDSGPQERPRLNLQPRTKPVETPPPPKPEEKKPAPKPAAPKYDQ